MKDVFYYYYRPTAEEFKALWSEAFFSFDANVLLHTYRYTAETRELLFYLMGRFKDRIWIPHQAGLEFHRNRLEVISGQVKAYDDVTEILASRTKSIKDEIEKICKNHSFIDANALRALLDKAIADAGALLGEAKNKHPNLLNEDTLLMELTELLDGKVGTPYDYATMQTKLKDAETRFQHSVPPGYKDAINKKGDEKYGDAIIWFQLIEHAIQTKKPVIFITDDAKEDWYQRHSGKTIGPRPELVKEMYELANVKFHTYQTDQFMRIAQQFLKITETPQAIEEVRRFREEEELREKQQASLRRLANLQKIAPSKLAEDIESDFYDEEEYEDYDERLDGVQAFVAPSYALGEKIRHLVYGQGLVVGYKGNGNDAQVSIAFTKPGVGVKKFIAGFARLEKV